MKLLFVCYGNTCRSPMAAALASKFLKETEEIHSAGTDAVDGAHPSREAVEVMREWGLDISNHRAKSVSLFDLDEFDMIVAMDRATAGVLIGAFGVNPEKIKRLNIADPYGEGIDAYRKCAREIESALYRLFRRRQPNVLRN